MSEGIDSSWARPGGAAVAAAGKKFIMRYVYPDGEGGKGLDADEVADYRANGLLIGLVYESSALRSLGGHAAGVADAQVVVGQLAALGMTGTPVHFGVDFDVTNQEQTINEYIGGAASVLGYDSTGVYGEYSVIEACTGVVCRYGWQTYAWSAGQVSSKANVYQYLNGQSLNGSSVDFCRNLTAEFGAFGGTAPASAGAGVRLMVNATSLSIAQIQHLLNAAGASLVEDGINGPLTAAAAGAFQSSHGLVADEVIGPLTLAALQGTTAAPVSSPAPNGIAVDGSWGSQTTRALQTSLGVAVDGILGPQTYRALQNRIGAVVDGIWGPNSSMALQRYLGVAVDGIVGPNTVKALQSRLNSGL